MTHSKETIEAVELLKRLIATPSISRDETAAADIVYDFLAQKSKESGGAFTVNRTNNNVWCMPRIFETPNNRIIENPNQKVPTILLNAHIDTVKPVAGWQRDPFAPTLEGDTLYGLGSNDCGGGLVALMETYLSLITPPQPSPQGEGALKSPLSMESAVGNLTPPLGGWGASPSPEGRAGVGCIFLASAEEEVSGKNGIESVLPLLPTIDFAIVGEPTGMQPAIAEKGLMVIDAVAHGKAGHAARNEGDNAIYHAMKDIQWLSQWQFPKQTDLLGPVKNTVTIVNAGTQHNVIPDTCTFTIDVRSNECYTNEEILSFLQSHLTSDLKPRSTRLSSSRIDPSHPFVQACIEEGLKPFGSPTLSDQALMRFPSLKLGPGDSARSHTADEFIRISEIDHAIVLYKRLLASYCRAHAQL